MTATYDVEAYDRLDQAFVEAGRAMQEFASVIRHSTAISVFNLRIAFAETPKEARYWKRELARFTRKPSLIHKGGKKKC